VDPGARGKGRDIRAPAAPRRRATAYFILVLAGAFLCASLSSCYFSFTDLFAEAAAVTDRVKDSQSMAIPQGQPSSSSISTTTPFTFLVVGDPHFGASFAASGTVLNNFATLAASADPLSGKPYAFVVFVGDDTNTGSESQYQAFSGWANALKDSGSAYIKWYSAVGNHDLYNGGWSYFKKYLGPSFYRLTAGSFSIYFVDSGQGTLGNYQIDALRSAFASDPKPKIVVSHYPIYGGASELYYYRLANPREVAELLDLFGRYDVKLIIAGHYHYYVHENVGGAFDEYLVDSLTVSAGGSHHCLAVTLNGGTASVTRPTF
jgi:3',5'-cyclic AMP phosphodiesterase CpdA